MISTPTPLLATKFFCPPPSPNLVPRPRLFKILEGSLSQANGFNRKLTLISAPAGYGKTTLVATWLCPWEKGKVARPKVAWLSLDDSDNDPTLFLSYLITALQRVENTIGSAALPILQSPQPPPMQIVLTALLNDLAALSQSIILEPIRKLF